MTWKRIIRDLSILGAICGTFYVSALIVGNFNAAEGAEESLSAERKSADRSERRQDWSQATIEFEQLALQDPFNGFAKFKWAENLLKLRELLLEKIEPLTADDANSARLTTLQQQLSDIEDRALLALREASEFLRYRGKTLKRLAILHAQRDEYEQALATLEMFVSEGYWLHYGIASVESFGTGGRSMSEPGASTDSNTRLHRFPKFWELYDREYEVRLQNLSHRSATVFAESPESIDVD